VIIKREVRKKKEGRRKEEETWFRSSGKEKDRGRRPALRERGGGFCHEDIFRAPKA